MIIYPLRNLIKHQKLEEEKLEKVYKGSFITVIEFNDDGSVKSEKRVPTQIKKKRTRVKKSKLTKALYR